jgi:Phosphoesterase family
VPGPTWPNRFFALSGTSSGRVKMPEGIRHPDLDNALFNQDQVTLFDRLNERGIDWKIYFYDFPCSLLLRKLHQPHNLANYHIIDHFFLPAKIDRGRRGLCKSPQFPAKKNASARRRQATGAGGASAYRVSPVIF